MNFFVEQDNARKYTQILLVLFTLAVIVLIMLTNFLVAAFLWMISDPTEGQTISDALLSYLGGAQLLWISLGVCGVVASAVAVKWWALRAGGRVVAEALGGESIAPNTSDFKYRKLLNVVEEIAIASGLPVPAVYCLKRERGINAFTAGFTPADAVIGVTEGAIEQLNRDQLQGVIAHEFSHMLNGDMRFNLRLVAVLHGIAFIGFTGRMLMPNFDSRVRGTGAVSLACMALGLGLMAVGLLGVFFGNMIKAAINRQREYLADASAVQFTRNPQGIAEALKTTGGHLYGSYIRHTGSLEVSHLFFGGSIASPLFATHPPLEVRIKRLDPQWDGQYMRSGVRYGGEVKPASNIAANESANASAASRDGSVAPAKYGAKKSALIEAMLLESVLGLAEDNDTAMPEADIAATLLQQVREPYYARAMMLALLLDDKTDVMALQCHAVKQALPEGLDEVMAFHQTLKSLPLKHRLELIERAIPSLKCLSQQQYQRFKKTLARLAQADGRIDLFEWSLHQLITHYCDAHFFRVMPTKTKYKTAQAMADHYQVVLSALTHYGDLNEEDMNKVFGKGANVAGLYTIKLLPKTECGTPLFHEGIAAMRQAYPLIKGRLLKGLVESAKQDGVVKPQERELLTAIAALLDCTLLGLAA